MRNNEMISQDEFNTKWLVQQIYGDIMPSEKWYSGCENRNDEICRDERFEGTYKWMKVDEYKAAKEYRGMVNEFRKRMGWEDYDI